MKNIKNTLVLFCTLLFAPSLFASEVFRSFHPGRFDSSVSVNYFKTESNFSSDGAKTDLPPGYTFQTLDTLIDARYVLFQDLGLYAGATIGNSESTDSISTRKNSSLSYAMLGADYFLYHSELISMYFDFSFNHAMEKVKIDGDTALNSDGADEIRPQVVTIFNLDGWYPYLQAGLNYRTEGLSTLLTYSGGFEVRFDEFALGAAVNGIATIKDDEKTNTPYERDAATFRVDGSSKKYFAVNPNSLDGDVYLKYAITSDMNLKVNGGYTILGSNAAIGYHVGAGLTWGFGEQNTESPIEQPVIKTRVTRPKTTNKKPKADPHFQEDVNDGVNQDYFKPVSPSKDDYIEELEPEEEPAARPKKKYITSPKAVKEMEAADYKIKLKKKVKKK